LRTLNKTDAKLTSKQRRHECYERIMNKCICLKENPDDWEQDACVIFTALSNNCKGHGRVRWNGILWYPHRLMYLLVYGVIPEGWDVHHTCGNPGCCNPNHLMLMRHDRHSTYHNLIRSANANIRGKT
jgi:hypothetical protein